MAWTACNKMDKIWKSQLYRKIKTRIFRVIIEPILLYGSETWTLSAKQHRRLLRRVLNLSWKKHPTLDMIYGDLPRISTLVQRRRVQFAGHCAGASDELVSSFLLWRHPSTLKLGSSPFQTSFPGTPPSPRKTF